MTERTYGEDKRTLDQLITDLPITEVEMDLIAHLSELQAENAKLAMDYLSLQTQADEALQEIAKLKDERREFCMRVANKIAESIVDAKSEYRFIGIAAIVEQELAK